MIFKKIKFPIGLVPQQGFEIHFRSQGGHTTCKAHHPKIVGWCTAWISWHSTVPSPLDRVRVFFLAATSSSISPLFCVCVCVCVSVCLCVCVSVRYVLCDNFAKVNLEYFLKSQIQISTFENLNLENLDLQNSTSNSTSTVFLWNLQNVVFFSTLRVSLKWSKYSL